MGKIKMDQKIETAINEAKEFCLKTGADTASWTYETCDFTATMSIRMRNQGGEGE